MRAIRSSVRRTLLSAGAGCAVAPDEAAIASPAASVRLRIPRPSSCPSTWGEQCVQRARSPADLLQSRIAQAAVPIESDGAVEVAVLDQKLRRSSVAACTADRLLDRVRLERPAVDREDLRADGQTGIERRAVPQHTRDLAVIRDHHAAGISEIAILGAAFAVLDPLGRLVGEHQSVPALRN